jgi:formylglycine-generating enzyme required for sulfatase activity
MPGVIRAVFRSVWLMLLAACAGAEVLRGEDREERTGARVAALIEQLGDDQFERREEASRTLRAVGEPALAALRIAGAESHDLEIRQRARQLVREIVLATRNSKSTGMQLTIIAAGDFQMGSPPTEINRQAEEMLHRVTISRPFLLGMYEVTQAEYQRVMNNNPSWFSTTGGGRDKVAAEDTRAFPVENVTWLDCIEFCNRLSKLDGYPEYYRVGSVGHPYDFNKAARVTIAGGNGYRLPTEAEWEYACRAGTTQEFHFGRSGNGQQANAKTMVATGYGTPSKVVELGRTARVGSYPANPWRLYDMHGNVGEWCWDWHDKKYYAASPLTDPRGPDQGMHRVVRSGSWLVNDGSCRSASRFWSAPEVSNYYTGFRVARTP